MASDPLTAPPALSSPVAPVSGVLTLPPPAPMMAATLKIVTDAAAQLSPDARGGFIPVVTTKGVNAAIVQRLATKDRTQPFDVKVVAWVGKVWGEPVEAGGAGVIEW